MKHIILAIILLLVTVGGVGAGERILIPRDAVINEYHGGEVEGKYRSPWAGTSGVSKSYSEKKLQEYLDSLIPEGFLAVPEPQPSYWQIRSIPLSDANDFLKANPEWEPFGIYDEDSWEIVSTAESPSRLTIYGPRNPKLYLKRRQP